MSDVLDIIRAQRPEPHTLDAATRLQLRARVIGQPDADDSVRSQVVLAGRSVDDARRDRHRGRLVALAAAVLMVAGIVGVWAAANRPGSSTPPPAQQPTTAPPSEPTIPAERQGSVSAAPDGAMILDQYPAALSAATGYSFDGTPARSEPPSSGGTWIERWYTTTMDRPELQPRLKLATTSSTQQYPPAIPPEGVTAISVTVNGADAWLYDDPASNGRTVAFQHANTVFVLTSYQLSDEALLIAADHTVLAASSDGGAVIDATGLPAGLIERAVGTTAENLFVPLESVQHPRPSIRWYNPQPDGAAPGDGEPMLWLGWSVEDPDLLALHRLDYETVTDTTVHGRPGFIATNDSPAYLGVVWSEGGYTYTLGGFGLDRDTVLTAANQLRPASDTDWATLTVEPG